MDTLTPVLPPSPELPPEEFRAAARAYLSGLLPPRDGHASVSVLGAGTNDFGDARRFLQRVGRDGWSVPTWPARLGGVGLKPSLAELWREELLRVDLPDLYV